VLQSTAGRHLDIIPGGKVSIYGEKKVTGRELNNRINRFANALMFLGINKGYQVVILFHDWMIEIAFAVINNKRENNKWKTKALRI
jgi:non-ribosomal peptide synthetase component E (peptide arylation enzyme)